MQKINLITSTFVPLPMENVDTDQIIPARFLKTTTKKGFGDNLFYDWRYDDKSEPIQSFVLNNPDYGGEILVTGKNFGCGSSREHAAWAVAGYGFRVVVSSSFADIFRSNALNNGILPVVVSNDFLSELFDSIKHNNKTTLTVDLGKQQVTNNTTGRMEQFAINPFKCNCLLQGLDDIDYLLANKEKIALYEKL